MTAEKKCPYCGADIWPGNSYYKCGTDTLRLNRTLACSTRYIGKLETSKEAMESEIAQVKAERDRLRNALERIGTGGYGPHASRAISVTVSEALPTPEPEEDHLLNEEKS